MTTEICTACHGIGGTQSQSRPGRIIAQCGSCGGTGEIELDDE